MMLSVSRSTIFRIAAVLMLLIAGAQAYACSVSDSCITAGTTPDGCDQPLGDNCLCCCHHVVPSQILTLQVAERLWQVPPPEAAVNAVSISEPIDHPPQL
jgi:hypothetical protein